MNTNCNEEMHCWSQLHTIIHTIKSQLCRCSNIHTMTKRKTAQCGSQYKVFYKLTLLVLRLVSKSTNILWVKLVLSKLPVTVCLRHASLIPKISPSKQNGVLYSFGTKISIITSELPFTQWWEAMSSLQLCKQGFFFFMSKYQYCTFIMLLAISWQWTPGIHYIIRCV